MIAPGFFIQGYEITKIFFYEQILVINCDKGLVVWMSHLGINWLDRVHEYPQIPSLFAGGI